MAQSANEGVTLKAEKFSKLTNTKYSESQPSRVPQKSNKLFCRILTGFSKEHCKHTFQNVFRTYELSNDLISNMVSLCSFPSKLSLKQFETFHPQAWAIFSCLLPWGWKINDNRLANFDVSVIQSKSFKQAHLCNSNANITQFSPIEAAIGNSLHTSPQSFYTQPKDSNKLSLSLQRLVKYVMNKSVTSNSELISALIAAGSCIHGNFSPLRID